MSDPLLDLFTTIKKRKSSKDKNSYTLKLLKEGQQKIAQKLAKKWLKNTGRRAIFPRFSISTITFERNIVGRVVILQG